MKTLQLTQIRKNAQAMDINSLKSATKMTTLRLLNNITNQTTTFTISKDSIFCLYINPLSILALLWHLLFLVIFYLIELQISVLLALGPTIFNNALLPQNQYFYFYLATWIFLIWDMAFSCLKGFYAFGKGRIVEDYMEILKHYLKTQFPFDIIVVLTYIVPVIYQSFGVNYIQLIPMLLLWVKKIKYQQQVQKFLQYHAGVRALFMFTMLFSDSLMMGNYGACIFLGMDLYLYGESYYGTGTSSSYYWLTDNVDYSISLIDGPWLDAYIWAQSFSTGTLSTLAPGPFARNPWQAFYAIVLMTLFVMLASYIGDVIIDVSYTYFQKRWIYQENIVAFDNYMQLKDVDKNVRMRVNNYFQLIWDIQMSIQSSQQEAMIDKLPNYLKQKLLLQIGFTKNIYFLYWLPQQLALKKMISLKIQRNTIDSNTCIYDCEKTMNNSKRYLTDKEGMAAFYLAEQIHIAYSQRDKRNIPFKKVGTDKILSLTNVEKMLGVYEFITGQNYSIGCRSIDLCLIESLSWTDFSEIIAELEIQQNFHELRHKLLIQREFNLINKICVICLQQHLESQCPGIMPKINIQKNINLTQAAPIKQNKRIKVNRKEHSSKKQVAIGQNYTFKRVLGMLSNVNFGRLMLQMNMLDGTIGAQIQQVAFFHNYFNQFNIANQ